MGKLFGLILVVLFGFLAMKAGWPWLIFLVPLFVFLLQFGLPEVSPIRPSTFTWLAAMTLVAMFCSWVIGGFLYGTEEGTYDLITAGEVFNFLAGTQLLKIFWAAVGGITITAALFAFILIPPAFFIARNKYGEYEQYWDHKWEATHTALASILGISQGTWIVKAGKAEVLENPSGSLARFGGPGILIVQQGHAVILERSGKITRIVTSGIWWLAPFEGISMVVPLKMRTEPVIVRDIVTKDRVILEKMELLVFHKADPGPEEMRLEDGPFAYNENILRELIWSPSGGDWQKAIQGITGRCVRDVVGRYELEQILPMSDAGREQFTSVLKRQINQITETYLGITVSVVDVGHIQVSEEVESRLLELQTARWAVEVAEKHKEEMNLKGQGEAAFLLALENARAGAQHSMIRAIRRAFTENLELDSKPPEENADVIVRLRYIEALERMADEPSARVLFPYGMPFAGTDSLGFGDASQPGSTDSNQSDTGANSSSSP